LTHVSQKNNKNLINFHESKMLLKFKKSPNNIYTFLATLMLLSFNDYSQAFTFAPLSTASISISTASSTRASSASVSSSSNPDTLTLSSSSMSNTTAASGVSFLPSSQTPTDCGIPAIQPATLNRLANRIVGGQEAIKNSFPWQVNIFGNNVFCGASLIDDNWIVTAAHCAQP
jgi:hypothetical protein